MILLLLFKALSHYVPHVINKEVGCLEADGLRRPDPVNIMKNLAHVQQLGPTGPMIGCRVVVKPFLL